MIPKRLKLFVGVFLPFVVAPCVSCEAADNTNYDEILEFTPINDNECTVKAKNKEIEGDIKIPSKFNGFKVTTIDYSAFSECNSLNSITIPSGIETIRSGAFENCSSLTTVKIYSGVKTIGNYAFSNCPALTTVSIPDSVTSIATNAFEKSNKISGTNYKGVKYFGSHENQYLCAYKALAVDWVNGKSAIHENCRFLLDYSFEKCAFGGDLIIPDSVVSIGDFCFLESSFHSAKLGKNVISIGIYAFYRTTYLSTFTVSESLKSIGHDAFTDSAVKYNEYENFCYLGTEENPYHWLMKTKDVSTTTCRVHDDCRHIRENAFDDCTLLETVSIPDDIVPIREYMFHNCPSMQYTEVFYCNYVGNEQNHCVGLLSSEINSYPGDFYINSGCRFIGDDAFYNCIIVGKIRIPVSVTAIGSGAFSFVSSQGIAYGGTMAQWKAISFEKDWWYESTPKVVYCSDGEVNI